MDKTKKGISLSAFFFCKFVAQVFIVGVTFFLYTNLINLVINAFIYLIGVCFDLCASAYSNYGPPQRIFRVCSKGMFFLSLFFIGLFLLFIMFPDEGLNLILNNTKMGTEGIRTFIYILMIGFGIISTGIGEAANQPKDD